MLHYIIIGVMAISGLAFSSSSLILSGGSYRSPHWNSAAQYQIQYEFHSNRSFSFNIGAGFMQSAHGMKDMTQTAFPRLGIKKYFKLNKMPFKVYIGAGFNVNQVPSEFGSQYVGTHLQGGILYTMNRSSFLVTEYQYNYGKTLNNGAPYSFEGSVISLGIGFNMRPRGLYNRTKMTKKGPIIITAIFATRKGQ